MNKWEISVWDDRPFNGQFKEIKLAVIGSSEMESEFRAREPKMVSNVNGTHKFSFKVFYDYTDNITGEKKKNPFAQYLFNERKIKVYWKDEWYDFIIKNSNEDTTSHAITFDCEDSFITELSRTGFGLTFDDELQNNIDTAAELTKKVIEGTTWSYDEDNSDIIYQKTEEAVWEPTEVGNFTAVSTPEGEEVSITSADKLLVYYSCCQDINNQTSYLQFVKCKDEEWITNENDMLVTNGIYCAIDNVEWTIDENNAIAKLNDELLLTINLQGGLSINFRADRYVRQQKSIFSSVVNRYVNIYEDSNNDEIYGYQTTEFYEPQTVVNLVANPNNYKNVQGWKSIVTNENGLSWSIYPSLSEASQVSTYNPTSYLKLPTGQNTSCLNIGLQSNKSYLHNGFQIGEIYILRCKVYSTPGTLIINKGNIGFSPLICNISTQDGISPVDNTEYFSIVSSEISPNWMEWKLRCIKACPPNWLYNLSGNNSIGIFLKMNISGSRYISDIQFFKEVYNDENVRLEPDNLLTTSVVKQVYKFFHDDSIKTIDELPMETYNSPEEIPYTPIYNHFEKMAHIEASESNRFNILQSITESFKCWIKFKIEHESNGSISRDENGKLKKFIQLKEQIGAETGINFIYGIDLKAIKRKIVSDKIATKTIVRANENQFGKNGFCTIARSNQNYPRETFIYNFDYFINKGMLDRGQLASDLQDSSSGLYHILHSNNTSYMNNVERLAFLKNELTKLQATQKIYEQYRSSLIQEVEKIESDLIKLSNTNNITDALVYAKINWNNTKVQTLVNDRSQLLYSSIKYNDLCVEIVAAISNVNSQISSIEELQTEYLENVQTAINNFENKYVRYIQEGTWSSEDYYDDNLYYIDAQQVAYTSSRPQVTYDISIIRISDLEDFKSKVFRLGDICSIEDTNFFGYVISENGVQTPYKEKIIISEITSYFETPEKDIIKVQNYKTQFDDLFQRIAAATQALEFSEGKYSKVADIINTDGTIKSAIIQNTFNENINLVQSSVNNTVVNDNTGITISDTTNSAQKVKVTAGGLFVSGDGGITWNNAIRGDGITADVITTGKLNTENIVIYNENSPSFSWDSKGINAYEITNNGTNLSNYVRFDKFGLYGIKNNPDFNPVSEFQVYEAADFGITWERFFLKSNDGSKGLLIDPDGIRIYTIDEFGVESERIQLGKYDNHYGLKITDADGNQVIECNENTNVIGGWTFITENNVPILQSTAPGLQSSISLRGDGAIGCFSAPNISKTESCFALESGNNIVGINVLNSFTATLLKNNTQVTIPSGAKIFLFTKEFGNREFTAKVQQLYEASKATWEKAAGTVGIDGYRPIEPEYIYFLYGSDTYMVSPIADQKVAATTQVETVTQYSSDSGEPIAGVTSYTYTFNTNYKINSNIIFTLPATAITTNKTRWYAAQQEQWSITADGNAKFYNIDAQYGKIAGWFIDDEKIYRTSDNTPNGPIVTELNSTGKANSDGQNYDMVAQAIEAAAALIGGVSMANGLIDGYSIRDVLSRANEAYSLAWSAYSKADNASSAVNALETTFANHKHSLTRTYSRLPISDGYTNYFWRVADSETGSII